MTRPAVSTRLPDAQPVGRLGAVLRLAALLVFSLTTGVVAVGLAFLVGGVARRLVGPGGVAAPGLSIVAMVLVIGLGGYFADRVVTYVLIRCPVISRGRAAD